MISLISKILPSLVVPKDNRKPRTTLIIIRNRNREAKLGQHHHYED